MTKNSFKKIAKYQDKIKANQEEIEGLGNLNDPKTESKRLELVSSTINYRKSITELTR
jgi:hypothetical protein